ncbi:MAG: hypothetical protein PHI88_00120 [Candidatus Pacebacteria bacterium]|nr:hypothetical protein [Candidatus Paceibacterota bacterium]
MSIFNTRKQTISFLFAILALIIIIALFAIFFINQGGIGEKKQSTGDTNEKTTNPEENTESEVNYKKADKQLENFYSKNPLTKYLPYYNDHFEIKYYLSGKNKASYKIKLHAYLNDADQFENYKEDYAQYKIEALEWIKSKGVDYKKLDIEWQPEDPKNISIEENSPANVSNCKTCK